MLEWYSIIEGFLPFLSNKNLRKQSTLASSQGTSRCFILEGKIYSMEASLWRKGKEIIDHHGVRNGFEIQDSEHFLISIKCFLSYRTGRVIGLVKGWWHSFLFLIGPATPAKKNNTTRPEGYTSYFRPLNYSPFDTLWYASALVSWGIWIVPFGTTASPTLLERNSRILSWCVQDNHQDATIDKENLQQIVSSITKHRRGQ